LSPLEGVGLRAVAEVAQVTEVTIRNRYGEQLEAMGSPKAAGDEEHG